jgi:hypothetical protein
VQTVSLVALERAVTHLDTPRNGVIEYLDPQSLEDPTFDIRQQLAENARAVSAKSHRSAFVRYGKFHRERSDNPTQMRSFALGAWIVARARRLHLRWLTDIVESSPELLPDGFVRRFETDVVNVWTTVQEGSYIQSRRAARGRSVSVALFDVIETTLVDNETRLARILARHMYRLGSDNVNP